MSDTSSPRIFQDAPSLWARAYRTLRARFRLGARRASGMRNLDTPWLLLLCVPLILLLKLWLPDKMFLPADFLTMVGVWLAARRWGLDAIGPTLILCLLHLIHLPALPGFGNIWMIPALLAVCRLGAEPELIGAIRGRDRIGLLDAAVLAAMLMSTFQIVGFGQSFAIGADPERLPALLLFGLLGATAVRPRILIPLLVVAVAAHWVLAPFRPTDEVRYYIRFSFGLSPQDAIEYCFAFAAGRVLSSHVRGNQNYAMAAVALWLVMLAVATRDFWITWPFGAFGGEAGSWSLFGGRGGVSILVTRSEPLISWTMLACQAVIAWRLVRTSGGQPSRWWDNLVRLLGAILAVLAIINTVWRDEFLGVGRLMSGLIAPSPETAANPFSLSSRAASFILVCAVAVAVTRRWTAGPPAPAPAKEERSFVAIIFGPIWAALAPAQFLCLAALALGLALGNPAKVIADLRQTVARIQDAQFNNVVGSFDDGSNMSVPEEVNAAGISTNASDEAIQANGM